MNVDLKEIAFIICTEIKADIDPRDADRAAAEIAKYLEATADAVSFSSGDRKSES